MVNLFLGSTYYYKETQEKVKRFLVKKIPWSFIFQGRF
uniref:Uncharacterized protein n=1 Tax=Siphoviridae sp. ctZHD14 TaxID=2827891 RepID=A0A8S5SVY8_9CAUD|nr:MAG TPA: hypothetical protein [Siphoviridae sp. ctZHD14]